MTYPTLVKLFLFLEIQARRTNSGFPKTLLRDIMLYLLNIFVTVAPKWEQNFSKTIFQFICKLPKLAGCFNPPSKSISNNNIRRVTRVERCSWKSCTSPCSFELNLLDGLRLSALTTYVTGPESRLLLFLISSACFNVWRSVAASFF